MAEVGEVSVEVGPGRVPTLEFLRKDLKLGKKIYIERDGKLYEKLKRDLQSEESSSVIHGDLNSLPLPPNSANSVFLKDVFSQQGIFSSDDLLGQAVNIGDFDHIIDQLHRAIRMGGKVVVLDIGTPLYGKDLKDLIGKFVDNGFEIAQRQGKEEMYYKGELGKIFDEDDPESEIIGRTTNEMASRDAYAIVFEKTS